MTSSNPLLTATIQAAHMPADLKARFLRLAPKANESRAQEMLTFIKQFSADYSAAEERLKVAIPKAKTAIKKVLYSSAEKVVQSSEKKELEEMEDFFVKA